MRWQILIRSRRAVCSSIEGVDQIRVSSAFEISARVAATPFPFVTVAADGCAKKYDSDSSEVVRSTVLTFTPNRAFNGAGAKFKIAFTPAVMTWFRTRCAARAGTALPA